MKVPSTIHIHQDTATVFAYIPAYPAIGLPESVHLEAHLEPGSYITQDSALMEISRLLVDHITNLKKL